MFSQHNINDDEEKKKTVMNLQDDSNQISYYKQGLSHSPEVLITDQFNSKIFENNISKQYTDARLRSQTLVETKISQNSSARKKWMKVSNVLRGISRMKRNFVKPIEDPNDIVENINQSPRRRKPQKFFSMNSLNFTKIALDDIRQQDRIFQLISEGGQLNLIKLQEELNEDPKKHFFFQQGSKTSFEQNQQFELDSIVCGMLDGPLGYGQVPDRIRG